MAFIRYETDRGLALVTRARAKANAPNRAMVDELLHAIQREPRSGEPEPLYGQAQVEESEPGRCAISGNFLRTFLSKVARGRLRCTANSTNRVS